MIIYIYMCITIETYYVFVSLLFPKMVAVILTLGNISYNSIAPNMSHLLPTAAVSLHIFFCGAVPFNEDLDMMVI